MKKIYSLMVMVVALIMVCSLVGCDTQLGSKYITNHKKYGKWESYLDIPSFLPTEIADYKVNSYSYTLLAYMDICFEIFLDISVTEEQFEQLIADAKLHTEYIEKEAYYCDGYFEIIFQDYYEIYHRKDDVTKTVEWADIEKIVYNPETLNIIYVCFHANDSGVYNLDEVAYFNRFSIKEDDYANNIE